MTLRIKSGEAGAAEAQLSVLAAPGLRVEPQELAAELCHVGLDLPGLLKFRHGTVKPALPFVGNAEANMSRDILGVGAQYALE